MHMRPLLLRTRSTRPSPHPSPRPSPHPSPRPSNHPSSPRSSSSILHATTPITQPQSPPPPLIPPPNYDPIQASATQIIPPTLLDLASQGLLLAYERPATYLERRQDGYVEPEQILILGTSHMSAQSALDVERVISTFKPDNVVVELCKSRSALLADDLTPTSSSNNNMNNPMLLSGNASMFQALARSTSLGGLTALTLRLVLGRLSSRFSQQLSTPPAIDMRAARRAAEAIDAQIVLGDRPIEITLDRTWKSLSKDEQSFITKGLFQLLFTRLNPDMVNPKVVQDMLSSGGDLTTFLESFQAKYPKAALELLHYRDMYLAWTAKRSKAANGKKRVVVVCGRGHIRGVLYALQMDQEAGYALRMEPLVEGRNTAAYKAQQRRERIRVVAKEVAIGVGCWAAWEYGTRLLAAASL